MNERIVKLFMQSVDSNYIPLLIEDHMPSWTEKFAELIVRECAKFLEENSGYDESNNAWHPASEDLLEHFGVEE